jgi:hypothetical protein
MKMRRAKGMKVVQNDDRTTRETKNTVKPEAEAQEADAGIAMIFEESLKVEGRTGRATQEMPPVTSGPVGSGSHKDSLQSDQTPQRA